MPAPRVIQLAEVPLRHLKPFKVRLRKIGGQDHCRWLFSGGMRDAPGTFFYKLWNPRYVRRDNVLAAVDAGFYDERLVPALYALVFSNRLCRGYVMHAGTLHHGLPVADFRDLVLARSRETGFFFPQFAASHTMIHDGKWSLLDLDAVYPLRDLPRLPELHCAFDDAAYRQGIVDLYRASLWKSGDCGLPAACPADPFAAGLAAPGTQRPLAWRFCVRRWRIAMRQVRRLVPRRGLIEA